MMKDEIIQSAYKNAFDIKDKSLRDLIIINTKCLVDNPVQRFVYMDTNRLKDELIYYRFYGEALKYNNILNILLPVIISNTNIQKSEDVAVDLIQKYVRYLKKDDKLFEYILSSVIYNNIIHKIIEDKNIKYEDLLQDIKQKIIGFSIDLDKIQTVKFQMARIKAIQEIDKYIDLNTKDYNEDEILCSMLNILYDVYIEDRNVENEGINSIKKSILSILGENESSNIENIDFVLSMSQYIIKLRKYKVNKKIYNKKADPRSLIKLEVGESTLDPILNQITIVSKNFSEDILNICVKSKSGIYELKFKKS